MAKQREFELVEAKSQSLGANTSSLEVDWDRGTFGFTTLECRGWSIVDTMEENLVANFKHTTFPIIQDRFTLFQATHAHGLSNNRVIKWNLRLELRGSCMLLRFLSSSSHLHIFYPISIPNQTKFELVGVGHSRRQTQRKQKYKILK